MAVSGWCPRICQEGLGEAEGTIQLGVGCLRRIFRSKAILWHWKNLIQVLWAGISSPISYQESQASNGTLSIGSSIESG